MKKITVFIFCCISTFIFSQNLIRTCGTPVLSETYENWLQSYIVKKNQFANAKTASVNYNLPIIFHIVHNGEAVGVGRNISMAQVNSQITTLNYDYRKINTDFSTWVTQTNFVNVAADCEINFCAARVDPNGVPLAEPGIDRINRTSKGWSSAPYSGFSGYIDNTIKPNSIWDPNKYLNIWILDMSGNPLGYAQFPEVPTGTNPITDLIGIGSIDPNTDGVVIDYRYVGSIGSATAPFNKGRTATHEIGHWLGLRHINGDSNCGNDYCADVPAQSNLSSTCPTTAASIVAAGCGSSPNPPGRMYQNYMDYTEDKCIVMFTNDQKTRIQACLANCPRRSALATSTVCTILGTYDDLSSHIDMNIFPNPTDGELLVSVESQTLQGFTILVVNPLGQVIKEVVQNQDNGSSVTINLENIDRGIYFVNVKSKNGSKTKRIILQ